MEKVVSLDSLIEEFDLDIINITSRSDKEIVLSAVHKPGAELTGFVIDDIHEMDNSIHILGKEEVKYLNSLSEDEIVANMKGYFSHGFPCIIVSSEEKVPHKFIELAKIYDKAILKTSHSAENFTRELRKFLQAELALEIVLNRYIFLEIFGLGVLLSGERNSVIGTTIELLEKGHRFVSDQMLNIKKINETTLIGENGYTKDVLTDNYFLNFNSEDESINIVEYFGIGATRKSKQINLIVKLEPWNNSINYDRIGLEEKTQYLLGIEIPQLTLPVRKGRNLAIIIETAAMNIRMKQNGQNPVVNFLEEIDKLMAENRRKRKKVNKGGDKMGFMQGIAISDIKDQFQLEVLNGDDIINNKLVFKSSYHRPSLEFSGYYDVLDEGGFHKLQIISDAEFKYLDRMDSTKRKNIVEKYFEYDFPAIVLAATETIPDYFLELAKQNNQVILRSNKELTTFLIDLTEYLDICFAPNITVHGVMVEVYGFGVLLKGKSGIGKSETALELIHRGHRLIADDMVKLTKYPDGRIIGKAEKVPYFMEIRGLGIIDIKTLYGLGSVKKAKKIDLIIELKELKDDEYLAKGDFTNSEITIMDETLKKIDLFVSSGRNAASMVEIATMRLRAKKLGYNSNDEYTAYVQQLRSNEG